MEKTKIVKAIVTNFHQPQSTLLLLVSIINPGKAWELRQDLWEQFLVNGKFDYTYNERIIHVKMCIRDSKNTKRVNNILLASKGDAALVADILYATRIKLKHRDRKSVV